MLPRLRQATMRDAYALWIWRNDPVSLAGFLDSEPVSWDRHMAWLDGRLHSGRSIIAIAEVPSRPVGSIRIDASRTWSMGTISYVVAPEARRRGVGRWMIGEFPRWLAGQGLRPHLYAVTKPENIASERCFLSCGWSPLPAAPGLKAWHRLPEESHGRTGSHVAEDVSSLRGKG